MLTEGMDLPSITGVMPLRNLGQTKLIQVIGRALRLLDFDRKRLYSGELSPQDYQNYVKPYGYMIIVRHLSTLDENNRMIDIVKQFYSEYGIPVEQLVISSKFSPIKPEQLETQLPLILNDKSDYDLEHSEFDIVNQANLSMIKDDMDILFPYIEERRIKSPTPKQKEKIQTQNKLMLRIKSPTPKQKEKIQTQNKLMLNYFKTELKDW
jgi:hypothetical protein